MHPFGPRMWGPHDGKSGPGLLSQVNGRVTGSCKNASAPSRGLLRCRCCLQLGQDMRGAGQQSAGDRHRGDVLAAAADQLTIGVGEHRVALGRLGGLLQDPPHPGRALLVMWPWRTVRSELRTCGVSPARVHSLRAEGKAADVADLGDQRQGRQPADTGQGHERLDPGVGLGQGADLAFQPPDRGGQGVQQPTAVLDDPPLDRWEVECGKPGPPGPGPQEMWSSPVPRSASTAGSRFLHEVERRTRAAR